MLYNSSVSCDNNTCPPAEGKAGCSYEAARERYAPGCFRYEYMMRTAGVDMAILKVASGAALGQRFEINSDQLLIGRAPFCGLKLEEQSVSRQHARIVHAADGYYLEDLESLNGTYVNGRRIRRCRLRDHDCIHIYKVLLEFLEAESRQEDSSSDVAEMGDAPSDSIRSRTRLHALLQMTRSLAHSLDLDELLARILDHLFEMLPQTEQGCILLPDGDHGDLKPHAFRDRRTELEFSLSPACWEEVWRAMTSAKALRTESTGHAEDAQALCRTAICAPLIGPSRRSQGVIHLESFDHRHGFGERDLELLQSAAAIGGQAVEYVHVHLDSQKLIRRQMAMSEAKEVQLHLLPQNPPQVPGYQFFHYYQAAEEVGGDYFGYFPVLDGRWAIAVGDVVGKGVPAALLMAQLGAETRACLAAQLEPADALTRLNQILIQRTGGGRMTTFVLLMLDAQHDQLVMANAGHMSPLLRDSHGMVTELGLDIAGLPLGVEVDELYQQATFQLSPGDTIVLYTDGINEAATSAGIFYGLPRIRRTAAQAPGEPAALARFLLADLWEFTKGGWQRDDICLVTLGRVA